MWSLLSSRLPLRTSETMLGVPKTPARSFCRRLCWSRRNLRASRGMARGTRISCKGWPGEAALKKHDTTATIRVAQECATSRGAVKGKGRYGVNYKSAIFSWHFEALGGSGTERGRRSHDHNCLFTARVRGRLAGPHCRRVGGSG